MLSGFVASVQQNGRSVVAFSFIKRDIRIAFAEVIHTLGYKHINDPNTPRNIENSLHVCGTDVGWESQNGFGFVTFYKEFYEGAHSCNVVCGKDTHIFSFMGQNNRFFSVVKRPSDSRNSFDDMRRAVRRFFAN